MSIPAMPPSRYRSRRGPSGRSIDGVTKLIVVAGTAGGVGTTTLAALLVHALSTERAQVEASDHSAGQLRARLVEGSNAWSNDVAIGVHDLGSHALNHAAVALPAETMRVIVTRADSNGVASALRSLAQHAESASKTFARSPIVVVMNTTRRGLVEPFVSKISERSSSTTVVGMPFDPTLATRHAIDPEALRTGTRDALARVATTIRHLLT